MWAKLKRQIWQWRGVLFAAPSAAGLVLLIRGLGLLQGAELWAFDQLVRWRPQEEPDDRIVIVGISEKDLQTYNFPISDRLLADALNKIKQQQPRVIGLDIYRDLPVPPNYDSLVETFRKNPNLLDRKVPIEPGYESLMDVFKTTENLIGIEKITADNDGNGRVAAPPLLKELDRVASNDIPRDSDLKVRRGLFYLQDTQTGDTVLSLAFRLAMLYLEKEGIVPDVTEKEEWVRFKTAVFPVFSTNDGGYVRADDAGYQVLLNYRGPTASFQTVELQEVLNNKIPSNLFRDRIVLIGSTAPSLNDYLDTPYTRGTNKNWKGFRRLRWLSTLWQKQDRTTAVSDRMSGVEIHANLTSQILSATLDGRTLIKVWSDPVEWLWVLVASTAGAILSWQWRYAKGVVKFLPPMMVLGGLGGIAYVAFLGGWWIPVVPPALALASSVGVITAYVARTAGEIRKTFSRYLTDEVVATLLETPEGLEMGGEKRTITILTSDLCGFTSTAERKDAKEVVSILNIYLDAMANVITAYQGTIDEFMGDGILVLFGAPVPRPDDPERAVACAVAMQLAMTEVNRKMKEFDLELEMGIGINTGEVVVGNIGSLKRTKYGVVGREVNLTYRIESYTEGGQILISESTLEFVKDIVKIDDEQKVSPKGVKKPITIYSIAGIGGKHDLFLKKEEDILVALPEAIAVKFAILDGKHVSDTLFDGEVVELGHHSALVRSLALVSPLSNLRFAIVDPKYNGNSDGEFYGKVRKKSARNETEFYIGLTSSLPEVEVFLKQQYEACKS
ncbi:MAG: adenylate/guanylate cyclase domain-containing protein [Cyanobacteria bacterium J055]|nr:MAG: adenylate/guanylate cyclase domain-containing protein [Cyanobacteria bacterium J055]